MSGRRSRGEQRETEVQDEQKYEEPQRRDKDDYKQQASQQKSQSKSPSREVELRESYEHSDFSSHSGLTPAQRLERMSKAANLVQDERIKEQKAKEAEQEKEWWAKEQAGSKPVPIKEDAAPSQSKPVESSKPTASEPVADQKTTISKSHPRSQQSFQRSQQRDDEDDAVHEEGAWESERTDKMESQPREKMKGGTQEKEKTRDVKEKVPKGRAQKKEEQSSERDVPKDKMADQSENRYEFQDRLALEQRVGREVKDEWRDAKRENARDAYEKQTMANLNKQDMLAHEQESLERTLREREAEGFTLKDDPDAHVQGRRETFKEQMEHTLHDIVTLGGRRSDEHQPVQVPVRRTSQGAATAFTPSPSQIDNDAKAFVTHSIRTRSDVPTSMQVPTLHVHSSPAGVEVEREDGTKVVDSEPASEGVLSKTKHRVEDGLESVEHKLEHWKDEAVEKMSDIKHKITGEVEDAKAKGYELKEDAKRKGSEWKSDVKEKGSEWKSDLKEKGEEFRARGADLDRDIRDDMGRLKERARETIEKDKGAIKAKAREWKEDVKEGASEIKAKVHEWKEDIKDEIRDDTAKLKSKVHSAGDGIKRRTDQLATKIKPEDRSRIQEINHTDTMNAEADHPSRFDWGAPIRLSSHVDEKPSLMQRFKSWWSPSTNQRRFDRSASEDSVSVWNAGNTGSLSPRRQTQWDRDNQSVYGSQDPIGIIEGSSVRAPAPSKNDRGIRSQLSNSWQHIKDDFKNADHVSSADQASSQEIDDAPSSPRSPILTAGSSNTMRPNTFSPSLSDVTPSSRNTTPSPTSARTTHVYTARARTPSPQPIAVKFDQMEFDPVRFDAAVEPW